MRQITQGTHNGDGEVLDHGTGLSTAGAYAALQALLEYGLVIKVGNNNIANEGTLYALQLDTDKVDGTGLNQRASHQLDCAKLQTSEARNMKKNDALLSNRNTIYRGNTD